MRALSLLSSPRMSARLADTLERCIPAILEEWGRVAASGELQALCDEDRVGDLAVPWQGRVSGRRRRIDQAHQRTVTRVSD